MAEPKWGDSAYDLLFKTVQGLEPFVSSFQAPKWGDSFWDLLYKLNSNLGNFSGGGGGGNSVQYTTAPTTINDFSMFPGGVAPSTGVYLAPRDAGSIWEFSAGQPNWKIIYTDNP